ncbi:MAG: hypothetical protein JSR59_07690 [Proteobacteria bacterium]|nr:hypothetical protein [Pseudomonadota bacterium]
MLLQIVEHTPVWVWGLLAALIALGASQARDRDVSLGRVTVLPFGLIVLSLFGVTSAFGHQPTALFAWLVGAGAAAAIARRLLAVRGATWSSATRLFHVPGSWLPMVLILGLFAVKYFAGACLAIEPRLAGDATFAGSCSLAYGVFSGCFLGRALSLRRVAGGVGALSAA